MRKVLGRQVPCFWRSYFGNCGMVAQIYLARDRNFVGFEGIDETGKA